MNELIAIVDDEPDILELVALHLEKASFHAARFSEGEEFVNYLDSRIPDLVILDLMLPDMDGLEICKTLRRDPRYSAIPIIMLTAKSEESDKIVGLELGADDYVTKPFSPKELVARVKAVLRRKSPSIPVENQITIGENLIINPEKYQVTVDEKELNLTTTEFRILHVLSQNKGIVFSRNQILDHLWGSDKSVLDRTIDVHIKNLRDKLGKAGNFIKNIRGVGYKLET